MHIQKMSPPRRITVLGQNETDLAEQNDVEQHNDDEMNSHQFHPQINEESEAHNFSAEHINEDEDLQSGYTPVSQNEEDFGEFRSFGEDQIEKKRNSLEFTPEHIEDIKTAMKSITIDLPSNHWISSISDSDWANYVQQLIHK